MSERAALNLVETKPLECERECSFCGKPEDEVEDMLTGPCARICNECVALCADLLQKRAAERSTDHD